VLYVVCVRTAVEATIMSPSSLSLPPLAKQPHILSSISQVAATMLSTPILPASFWHLCCAQSAQSCRDAAQNQADASKKQLEHLKARFSAFEQHEQELLGQLASAEAGMRGSRVTSSRLLQEGQRLEITVRLLLLLVVL
jgi:hypothetical protein